MKQFFLISIVCIAGIIAANAQQSKSPCFELMKTAEGLLSAGKYKEAVVAYQKVLQQCNRDTSVSDNQYYFQVLMLTIAFTQTGMHDSAIVAGKAAYNFYEKNRKPNATFYAFLNSSLGQSYAKLGYHEQAIFHLKKSYADFLIDKESTRDIIYMEGFRLFESYMALQRYNEAKAVIIEVEERTKKVYNEETLQYGICLRSLAQVKMALGEMNEVVPMLQKALGIIQRTAGKMNRQYSLSLNFLAYYYSQQKDYSNAFYYYDQERTVLRQMGDTTSTDYIGLLNSIALMYKEVGRSRDALYSFDEAFVIARRVLGMRHELTVGLILNMGATYVDLRNYRIGADFGLYAYDFYTGRFGKESPKAVSCLNTLGVAYSGLKKYDSSNFYNREAIRLMRKLYGDSYTGLTSIYTNIGTNFFEQKRYDSALAYYDFGYKNAIKTFPLVHPYVNSITMNMFAAYKDLKNWNKADSLVRVSARRQQDYIIEYTTGLSESEKADVAQTMRFIVFSGLNLRQESGNNLKSHAWLLDAILFYKGLLLESSRGLAAAVKSTGDATLQDQFGKYQALKKKIGQAMLSKEMNVDSKVLDQWKNEVNDLERQLFRNSSVFSGWQERQKASYVNVQKKLKKGEAAIEYVAFYKFNETKYNFNYYAAFVLRPDMNEPTLVFLKNDSAFQLLTKKTSQQEILVKRLYRSTIGGKASASTNTDSLYGILWRPLQPYLKEVSKVYFSTDGQINQLNLAAVFQPNGQRLVESYQLVQMASTRNLLVQTASVQMNQIELWGGIDYSTAKAPVFNYLPGTLTEVNKIKGMTTGKSTVITGTIAKEERFKQLDGKSPAVLHVATHGFFYPEPSKDAVAAQTLNRFMGAKDPMLRAGLALSGANIGWDSTQIKGSKEDGILTAYEISVMDLSKTKLVILSACETGLGDIQSGEGVYGLQRAFKLAGVDYLIMSLWQVPDQETQVFMELLYNNALKGMPIEEAFRATQLAMSQKYDPYQWAAFVLLK